MEYFDLEQYSENMIYDLLDYAISGTKATTTDSRIYDLYSETVTEVFNFANNTLTSKVNILSPELSTVCLIMFAINKTIIKTVIKKPVTPVNIDKIAEDEIDIM